MIKVIIPGNPTTKKNSNEIHINPKTGQRFVSPSQRFKEYQDMALWFVPQEGIDYPINLKCVYYREDKRKVDLCNLLEATCDILVKGGTIADDNYTIVASHDGSKVLIDRKNPRVEIEITRYEE